MDFQNLKQLVDVRNSLTCHRTNRFPVVGVNRKEDIAIHHSLTKRESSGSTAEGYANYHVNTHGWPGIGYHFVIEKDGTIKWCNNLDLRSYHVGNYNNQSVGICISGDFRTDQPTEAQKGSLVSLVNALKMDLPNYNRTLGHSDYPGYEWKQCPVLNWRLILENKNVVIPQTNETHTIKSGDTLWRIALTNNLTVEKVLSLNPGIDPHNLKLDQVINLKKKASQPTPTIPAPSSKQKVIGYVTILVPFLNRRAAASLSASVTGTVRKGQRLNVYEKKNGMYDLGSLDWISTGSAYTKFASDTTTPAKISSSIQLPTGVLRRGSRGAGVKELQKSLNKVNFKVGAEDGIFGANTEDGVRRFQSIYLPDEVDGIYGPKTRVVLLKRL